ncbi:MAG TPA: ethanolamine ammonia-lyase reactivating factor EutA [Usitatibacter sp.]|nr:ethanolamine ammonia-lyase reactivating factor EutA [Usitatibacter sp.]
MPSLHAHEGDGLAHVHELTLDQKGKLVEYIWKLENVELTTVGIDIGSSTSHLMFSGVRLQRKTQALSSQFVVIERKVIWKSPILLTPFLADGTIDAAALGRFVDESYRAAGLEREAIDTGAVILTGEAIKRTNARAIAELFAADSGRFVCASAGHHLECVLAAHGSGAVAMSRESGRTILNVDIGGGTTKLALAARGRVAATCAFAVGGRLVAFDAGGRVARIDESAEIAARASAAALRLGERPRGNDVDAIVDALADAAIAMIRGDAPSGLAAQLLLTEPLPAGSRPDAVVFSGGVSEYLYGRESREYGDIALALAGRITAALRDGRIPFPVEEPRERIRATVIGASQFTVQVSGKTIHISDESVLPLRNVPVIPAAVDLDETVDAGAVARAIAAALERAPYHDHHAIALAVRWEGDPLYARLRGLAEGIALAMAPPEREGRGDGSALVLMIDGDVGRTLGHILEHELSLGRPVISIDGIQLNEFDFVDLGEVIRPTDVVPVVIKSLLFPGSGVKASPAANTYKPLSQTRRAAS